MKPKIILVCLVLASTLGCKKDHKTNETPKQHLLERADWLIGRWESKVDGAVMIEEWQKKNDSVFDGFSIVIAGKDTVFNEKISLEQHGDQLVYTVSVDGQNQEKPVPFKLALEREKELRFENMQHDYPKVIVYTNPQKDSLVASIAARNGDKQKFFRFAKVQ
ncbi:MAG: hypothetical protein EOO48_14640 [Flavobacterium sp.]|nr:MAG: hypothetical protein EOO48_14640 [Flavobacterium sp.]